MAQTVIAARQAPAGSSIQYGTVTVDFGTGSSINPFKTVTVSDTSVNSNSKILVQVTAPGAGRDFDELEFASFSCYVNNIVANTSFDISVMCHEGVVDGAFVVTYWK